MDYIIAIKELCRYLCIIKWKIHVVLRITNEFTVQCCLLHDLFACDSNQFGLFGSKISLEVPVAAQFGLRAVAYISSHQVIEDFAEDSKKRQRSLVERPESRRTTQEDISIQITSVQYMVKQSVRNET
ncbi:hypothetical protein T08_14372 [Trichinella sp. T8]|nr:hypothetical protein T08_14372 [Trichinella sp. T8]